MYRKTLLAVLTLTFMSGCVAGPDLTESDYCILATPIWLSSEDILTPQTARAILSHNETWEALCG